MINQEKTLELVDRSQRKDTAAFAQLVTEFQPMVFRLAFRLLCDEDEARDITQETFVKVWLSLKTYNRKNRFSTWLYKITCNACYDRLRSLRHSSLNNEFAFSDSINLASDDNIEISLSNRQLKELILRYTNELPPQQKLVFMLRDVENESNRPRLMKQEDKKYEEWLTEIKNRQPILENPEELTAAILNKITDNAPKKKKIRYLVGAWISGTAATLLLFLFINDACFPPSPSEAETQNGYVYQPNGTSFPLPENWEEMQLLEKSTYLSSQYTQHRKLRQTRILQIIKENQLR